MDLNIEINEFIISLIISVVVALIAFAIKPVRTCFLNRFKFIYRAIISQQILYKTIYSTNMKSFIRERKDYLLYRGNNQSISKYIEPAKKELIIVGISLITGIQFEGIQTTLRKIINTNPNVNIHISLLNFNSESSMRSLGLSMNKEANDIKHDIKKTIDELINFRNSLASREGNCIKIYLHDTLPFASAIIIDPDEAYGSIQVESKPYGLPLDKSIGFALGAGAKHSLYDNLIESYRLLISDAHSL